MMDESRGQIYEFDNFRVDVTKRLLFKGETEIVPLMPRAFDTLLYLVSHSGKLIEKDELMREIWTDTIVEENNLTQNISILRRILGEKHGEHRFIATIPGHGYKFVAEVKNGEKNAGRREAANVPFGAPEFAISNIESQADQVQNTEAQSTGKIKDRKWLIGVIVFSVLVLGSLGFYLWREKEKTASEASIKTIAVLPFKPLVAENADEALELGMADALIAKLSGSEEVTVRPLSAIRRYDSMEQDSIAAGRDLGVESVLEGSIQTWGDRIRVSTKLLRTSDGKQLWAGQFDEKFTDIFAVQDSISERVASALKIQLGNHKRKHSTESVEAYQLYMKGRYHLSKIKPSEIQKSISYFQQAIDIDPNYALAYAHLSQAYRVLSISGEMPSTEVFPKAKAAALKSIELDDQLAEAHVSLGITIFWYDWDWSAAENQFRRASELEPDSAHFAYAQLLSITGRHAEAVAEAKRARELSPLDLFANAMEGQTLLHAGRTDEALDKLLKTSELEPNFFMPHLFASSAYIEKGMYAEAISEARREKELLGVNTIPFGAYALAKSGKPAEARAVLNELLKLSTTRYVPPYNIALIYDGLGERDKALAWLERAYSERDTKMTFLKVEPKWNTLRSEPRFISILKRMRLE
jgi:DNA-binding winged helix-turn-helix (wHTH) protein/TolB-like protein